jgi:GNAT superfamily N-acetyltransferase
MNKPSISFTTPQEANIGASTYKDNLKDLILQEIHTNPTMVLHTDEEIFSKYDSSIIAVVDGKIVGNASIYPTHMKPLDTLILEGKHIRVGEAWSVIIHPDMRGHGLGRNLIAKTLKHFSHVYDIIVEATVNDIMFTLSLHQGFERIPFPKNLYEEGKTHLASRMQGKEAEFEQRAKCLMYNVTLTQGQKEALIDILQNEYR